MKAIVNGNEVSITGVELAEMKLSSTGKTFVVASASENIALGNVVANVRVCITIKNTDFKK